MATRQPSHSDSNDSKNSPTIETWRSDDSNLHVTCGNQHLYDGEGDHNHIWHIDHGADSGVSGGVVSVFFDEVTEGMEGKLKLKNDGETSAIVKTAAYPDAFIEYLRSNC